MKLNFPSPGDPSKILTFDDIRVPVTIKFNTNIRHFYNGNHSSDSSRTEIRILDSRCFWEGRNCSFRNAFMHQIDLIESQEKQRLNSKEIGTPENQAIESARKFVNEAAEYFNLVQTFSGELNKRYNDLKLCQQTSEVQIHLYQIDLIRKDLQQQLQLPSLLNEISVKQYISNVQQFLEPLKQRFASLKGSAHSETSRKDVENTAKQGRSVLTKADEMELKNLLSKASQILENVIGEAESSLKLFEQYPDLLAKVRDLIRPANQLRKHAPSENTLTKEIVDSFTACVNSHNNDMRSKLKELLAERTKRITAEENERKETEMRNAIQSQRIAALDSITTGLSKFNTSFKELSNQNENVDSLFLELSELRKNVWNNLENKAKKLPTLASLQDLMKEINLHKDVDTTIINTIQFSIQNAQQTSSTLRGYVDQIKTILIKEKYLDQINQFEAVSNNSKISDTKSNATDQAIAAFVLADRQSNEHFLAEKNEDRKYFESIGHTAVAEHYDEFIKKFHDVANKYVDFKPTFETLEAYVTEWNQLLSQLEQQHPLFMHLKEAEENLALCWTDANNKFSDLRSTDSKAAKQLEELLSTTDFNDKKVNLKSSEDIEDYIFEINQFIENVDRLIFKM